MPVIFRASLSLMLLLIVLGIGASLGACASEAKETKVDSDHLTWGMDVDQAMATLESDG